MRELIIKSLRKSIADKAAEKYKETISVSVQKGLPMANNKCQLNSVHNVKQGDAVGVIECVIIGDDDCTAHYINLMGDNKIIDITLGWSWGGADYRFIRNVPDYEYGNINESLGNLKQSLCGSLPWYCKLLRINMWDLC